MFGLLEESSYDYSVIKHVKAGGHFLCLWSVGCFAAGDCAGDNDRGLL